MSEAFFSGAICMGFLAITLFFARFWKTTRDRLFLYFTAAFLLLLIERLLRETFSLQTDWSPTVYLLRLSAFGLILIAIADKNQRT